MKTLGSLALSALMIASVLSGCAPRQRIEAQRLDEKQTTDLAAFGAKNFGITWEKPPVAATTRGVMAVTDGVTTLTTRAGSRIFIVHNRKEFPPKDHMAFKGSDADLGGIGIRLLQASGANKDEVAEVKVLQQFTQSGETLPGGAGVRVLPPQPSHRTLMLTRRVAGVDVVSSRLMLNVDSAGHVVFMELAWPDISREVLDRALRLQRMIAARYEAPPLAGAEVEAVQPVVLHSPAIGFYNDATAAVRVIYRPNARRVGQKAVRYLDERGADVTLPRDVDPPREKPVSRPTPKP